MEQLAVVRMKPQRAIKKQMKQRAKVVDGKVEKKIERKVENNLAQRKVINQVAPRSFPVRTSLNQKPPVKMYKNVINKDLPTLDQLCMTIVAPEDTIPVRLGGFGAASTALAKIKDSYVPVFPSGNGGVCAANEHFIILFRNALRSIVYSEAPTAVYTYNALGTFVFGTNFANAPSQGFSIVASSAQLNIENYPKIAYYQSGASYSPHGTYLFCGSDRQSEAQYVYCNLSDTLTVNYVTFPGGGNIGFKTLNWTSGQASTYKNQVSVANAPLILKTNTDPAGWYAWTATPTVAGTYTFGVVLAGVASTAANIYQKCIPGLVNNIGKIQGYRVNSASARITNTASLNNRGGNVTAVQVPKGKAWTDFVSIGNATDPFPQIASAEGSINQADASNGLYTYLRPSEIADLAYDESVITQAGSYILANYPLISEHDQVIVCLQIPTVASQVFTVNLAYHVEYKTVDAWTEKAPCMLPDQTTMKILETLRFTPQFTENPMHWKDLWNGVKDVASKVLKGVIEYGPAILKFAGNASALL